MKKANKKFLISIGVLTTAMSPIAVVVSCGNNNFHTEMNSQWEKQEADAKAKAERKKIWEEGGVKIKNLELEIAQMRTRAEAARKIFSDKLEIINKEKSLLPRDAYNDLYSRSIASPTADDTTKAIINEVQDKLVDLTFGNSLPYFDLVRDYTDTCVDLYLAKANNLDQVSIKAIEDKLKTFDAPYQQALDNYNKAVDTWLDSVDKAFQDAGAMHDVNEITNALAQLKAIINQQFKSWEFSYIRNGVDILVQNYDEQIHKKEQDLLNLRNSLKTYINEFGTLL